MLFIFPNKLAAAVLFQENFDDGVADGWTVLDGGGYFRFYDGMYGAKVTPQFTVADITANGTDYSDYVYEIDMLALSGTDKNLIFRTIDLNNRYGFHISYGSIKLEKKTNGWERDITSAPITFNNGQIYRIKVVLNGKLIEIYQNGVLILSHMDNESDVITHGKVGLRIGTGADAPSEVYYDNILVCTLDGPCSTTPTPTPLQPLVLLPGLGASWNHEAMILDVNKPPEDWYMTPGVKSYDGIIQTLQNAGYVLGTDLFIFNYDWRKPVGEITNDLKAYIANIVHPPPGTEIDLVGHSLGGMVARTYIQNNPIDHNVDQLLTLGSPHHGVPQVYYLWEGADLNKTFKYAWMRIGAGVLIQLKKHGFENNVETVRQIFPGLKNLLPDFPYLKKDGVPKPIEGMSQQNQWLANMNVLPLPGHLISRLTTLLGLKGDTLHWIGIKPPDWFDQLLGRWEDGKPINEEFNMGDDSVLVTSGQLEGAEVIDLEGLDHGDLVESVAGQQQIVNKLGLSPTSIVPTSEISLEPALVFQLASPATIAVFGPNGWQIGEGVSNNIPGGIYSSADKLIIIPEPFEGNYETRVTGEGGGGNYRLLIGNVNPKNDFWREEDGQLGNGETKTHQINYNSQPKLNKIDLLKLAKTRLTEAKAKADTCRYPARLTLKGTIQSINEQVNMVIYLVKLNQEALAEKQLKLVIRSLVNLEKNFKFASFGCGARTQQEILFSLREARDCLLQAQEL